MIKRAAALVILLGSGYGLPALAGPAALPCTVVNVGFDNSNFDCPIPPTDVAQRFRFKANFSGGHDDTRAAMVASLDGTARPCDEGSKTELMGEDGEVSLECRFSVAAGAGEAHRLSFKVTWSHAQYIGFEAETVAVTR